MKQDKNRKTYSPDWCESVVRNFWANHRHACQLADSYLGISIPKLTMFLTAACNQQWYVYKLFIKRVEETMEFIDFECHGKEFIKNYLQDQLNITLRSYNPQKVLDIKDVRGYN